MRLANLDHSDNRTIELLIECHPDIKDDLSRVLRGLDQAVSEKAKQIEDLEKEVYELKEEIHDLCLELYRAIRQEAYNARVRAERKAEYLRLAGGNEEIAKAFWAKAEGSFWPTDDEVIKSTT